MMNLRDVVHRCDAIVELRQSTEQLADVHVLRAVYGGERVQNEFEVRGIRARRARLAVDQPAVGANAPQRPLELLVMRLYAGRPWRWPPAGRRRPPRGGAPRPAQGRRPPRLRPPSSGNRAARVASEHGSAGILYRTVCTSWYPLRSESCDTAACAAGLHGAPSMDADPLPARLFGQARVRFKCSKMFSRSRP